MKNSEQWEPTKFVWKKGKLRGSRNPIHLSVSSRLAADIVATYYQRYIPQFAKGAIIDLGCGQAPLYTLYKDYTTEVTCVDWENSGHPSPFLDQACDLTQPLPFRSETFDTILLSDVLEHIPEPEKLWAEMDRILRPNGKIILNVPFFYKLHETPHDYFRYSEFALRRFASKHHHTVITLTSTGGIPEIVTDLVAKLFAKVPRIGDNLSNTIQTIHRLLAKTGVWKNLSKKTSEQFPFGYFMVVSKDH